MGLQEEIAQAIANSFFAMEAGHAPTERWEIPEPSAGDMQLAFDVMPLVRRAQADAFTAFTDHYEKIASNLDRPDDATPEYWQGVVDVSDYFVARLRSHAEFIVYGHDGPEKE